ncbi:MAG: glutamine-hydrolyzing carbamoyl-phosphate synthase small subunit [Candidatus Symbiobacter sp.]|nr:glutamine-hydrolyzing carbamoyl-phosphate synthase small subunit [Candidatus Symbiobacter sp.]
MQNKMTQRDVAETVQYDAALILADGTEFHGQGFGRVGAVVGEVCFNTSQTGYQESLTDPSYDGQIITFTFPHIGNVGVNLEDVEINQNGAGQTGARGLIVRNIPTEPSNWRSVSTFTNWCERMGLVGIAGLDTRKLTRRIRDMGAPNGVLIYAGRGKTPDTARGLAMAQGWPGLDGLDLAKEIATKTQYHWTDGPWHPTATGSYRHFEPPTGKNQGKKFRVVTIDYGIKQNILRNLVAVGCDVTVLPATATASDVMACAPDGVFIPNGPGDPAATGLYAVPMLRDVLQNRTLPIFGICLGHQLLALAVGGKTQKMALGHRGANHPVKNLLNGRVEITSQNHGFAVLADSLPPDRVELTHISLFDGSVEGFRLRDQPVFAVQYHPESSPGPHDSGYLFQQFANLMK